MNRGIIHVYNQKVDHKVLAAALLSKREHLVCVLNLRITKFPLMEFMSGKFANKYDTFITKQDELLVINMVHKKTGTIDNRIILKSREVGCETEFKLDCLSYYSRLQNTINEQVKI